MVEKDSINYKIWQLTWPAILSNISIPLLGLVDAAILGHLHSSQFLGAVAIGASILSFLYWGFGFLRMGTTGLVARAFGAGDQLLDQKLLGQSLVLAVAISLAVILSEPLWSRVGLLLIAPEGDLKLLASSYIHIRVFSAPAALLTYAIVGWFIGHQNTRWPMYFILATNLLNIALDFLFIVGFNMGSNGAALATLIAEWFGCGLALWALFRYSTIKFWQRQFLQPLTQLKDYKQLLVTNQYLFFRTICLLASFAFFTAMSGRLGTSVLAGNAILLNFLLLASYGLDGFAHAAEALCGKAIGAGKITLFRRTVFACARWTGATAIAFSLFFVVVARHIFPIFTDLSAVVEVLNNHYYWLAAMPILAATSYLLDGVFIGIAQSKYMMYTMLVSTFLVYIPLWYLFSTWGNHGLWFSFACFHTSRGLGLLWCYWRIQRKGWPAIVHLA